MDSATFTNVRTELYNATVQSAFTLDATFLTPNENLIATTHLVADPKQLVYTKFSEMYSLDRENSTLVKLNYDSKCHSDTLATAMYTKDTSKKAYMVKTTGVHAGYRLEINQHGVRSHTVEINTPSYLKNVVPDLSVVACYHGPKALTPHGKVCYIPNLADQTLMWSPDGQKIMYLAEKASKIHDIHGKVPADIETAPIEFEDYLSG